MTTLPVPALARRGTLMLLDVHGAFESGPDGGWEFVTPRLLEILGGLPASSLLGREWIRRIHPDDAQRALAEYRQAREFRRPWQHRLRMVGADSVPVWLSIDASPLPAAPGDAGVSYVGLVKDVSSEVRAEQIAHQSEQTLTDLAELISEGLVITRDDFIIAANTAAARILGAPTADDLIGRPAGSFIAPGDEPRFAIRLEERDLDGPGSTYTGRIRRVSDGYELLVSVHGRSVQYAGATARIVSFVPADDPHIQAVLEDRNLRRLQSLESLLPLAYHRVSIEGEDFGHIEFANDRFAEYLGRRPEDIIGRSVLEFTHPEHHEASRQGMASLAGKQGRQGTLLRRWVHADGTDVYLELDISIYRDPVTGHAVSMALSRLVDPSDPGATDFPIR